MQYTANGGARPRMAYGRPATQQQQDMSARQDLFAGAEPADPFRQQQVVLDDMNTQQLMQHAVDTHKDTTAAAERSLKIVEQTKEIQASTHAALRDQGEQMHRIEADIDRIGEDLSYSERILRFMKLCCCVGFFCSCCTEPQKNSKDKDWRGSGSGYHASPPNSYTAPKQSKRSAVEMREQQRQQQAQQQAQYPGVSTKGLAEAGFVDEAGVIKEETQKQDRYLDEISKGLDQIKFGAQRMNEELRSQEAHSERIRHDADALQSKLHTVNRQGFKGM